VVYLIGYETKLVAERNRHTSLKCREAADKRPR
jgi:hypothetical protein